MCGLASGTIFSVAKIGRFPDAIKKGGSGESSLLLALWALAVETGASLHRYLPGLGPETSCGSIYFAVE